MASRIYWHDEAKTILIHHVEGAWTTMEFAEDVKAANAMIAEQPHRVHIINDFSQASMPTGKPGAAVRAVSGTMPPNRGLAIGVGTSMLIELLLNLLRSIQPELTRDIHIVPTMDEAFILIRLHKQDET